MRRRSAPDEVQIPLEIVLGPLGAVAVLLWWNHDLRTQRDQLAARLNKIVDALEDALKKAERP